MNDITRFKNITNKLKEEIRTYGVYNPNRPQMGEELCSILSQIGMEVYKHCCDAVENKSSKVKFFELLRLIENINYIESNKSRDEHLNSITFYNAMDYIEELVGNELIEEYFRELNNLM